MQAKQLIKSLKTTMTIVYVETNDKHPPVDPYRTIYLDSGEAIVLTKNKTDDKRINKSLKRRGFFSQVIKGE
jgi:hypothetical protein